MQAEEIWLGPEVPLDREQVFRNGALNGQIFLEPSARTSVIYRPDGTGSRVQLKIGAIFLIGFCRVLGLSHAKGRRPESQNQKNGKKALQFCDTTLGKRTRKPNRTGLHVNPENNRSVPDSAGFGKRFFGP